MTRGHSRQAAASIPTLSVVVPMFNEEAVLPTFFARLEKTLADLGVTYEIICVNDGSRDGTHRLLAEAHARDPRIRVLNFSRNFGKEIALTAGLDHAKGAAVVPIDADLQDPPELIATFLERWREGYEVVLGVRQNRNSDTWAKRVSAKAFYKVMNKMARIPIPANAGDFRLMDRRVVDTLRNVRERQRFMKGLFAWVGFRQCEVGYVRPERSAGSSKFNYWGLWSFALDGITGYSTAPLHVAAYLGSFTALTAVLYGAFLVLRRLLFGTDVPGYTSTMVAVLFLGGVQLTVLGILGEYLGRVYEETKHRPLYIIDSALGWSPEDLSACGEWAANPQPDVSD